MVHKQVNLFEKKKKKGENSMMSLLIERIPCVIKLPKLHVKSELMPTSPHLRS